MVCWTRTVNHSLAMHLFFLFLEHSPTSQSDEMSTGIANLQSSLPLCSLCHPAGEAAA